MSDTTPLVSVILPTYGRPALLRRSICSVLGQTYRNFELIVVDDCSPDDTGDVVRQFTDPRIRYFRRSENGRAAAARNDGLALARADLIAFQDDDDIWLPHKLEHHVQAMEASPPEVGLVLCSHIRWTVARKIRYIGGEKDFRRIDFSRGYRGGFGLIATPGWLVRREALERAGPFDVRLRSWDDWELGLRLWQTCRIHHLDEPLFFQDHVMGSAMMRNEAVFANDMKVILEKHGHLWEGQRILQSRHCYVIGRGECEFGSLDSGRNWLWKCIRLNPIHLWAWGVLLASYTGESGLRRASRWVRALAAPYRRVYRLWTNR